MCVCRVSRRTKGLKLVNQFRPNLHYYTHFKEYQYIGHTIQAYSLTFQTHCGESNVKIQSKKALSSLIHLTTTESTWGSFIFHILPK